MYGTYFRIHSEAHVAADLRWNYAISERVLYQEAVRGLTQRNLAHGSATDAGVLSPACGESLSGVEREDESRIALAAEVLAYVPRLGQDG